MIKLILSMTLMLNSVSIYAMTKYEPSKDDISSAKAGVKPQHEIAMQALVKQYKSNKTVEECKKAKEGFMVCQDYLTDSERSSYCGDFEKMQSYAGPSILRHIVTVCLKHAQY